MVLFLRLHCVNPQQIIKKQRKGAEAQRRKSVSLAVAIPISISQHSTFAGPARSFASERNRQSQSKNLCAFALKAAFMR